MSARASLLAAIGAAALLFNVLETPALAATGVLRVTSIPSRAEIWVDGAETGRRTPARLTLEEGSHTVTLVLPGGVWQPATEVVSVEPAARSALRIVMAPATDGLDALAELLGLRPEELTVPARAVRPADCRVAQVALSVGGATLGEPVGLYAREALSRTGRFIVAVEADSLAIDPGAFVGEPAELFLRANASGGDLAAAGIVTRAELASATPRGGIYVVEVEPALSRLRRRAGYAIYQDAAAPEVVAELLEEAGIRATFALAGTYPRLDAAAQAGETDFDFVNRLLEHEGIFYFASDDGGLLVSDTNASFASGPTLPYRGPFAPGLPEEATASSFRSGQSLVSQRVAVAGWDPVKKEAIVGSASQSEGEGELFRFDAGVRETADAERLARVELRRSSLPLDASVGTSNAPGVRPGRLVDIEAAGVAFSGTYLVTGVTHTLAPDGAGCFDYGNRFEAIPAATPFVPPRRTPAPSEPGLSTAIVEQVDPSLGLVRVRFPWDRAGEGESAWIRLGHPVGRNEEAWFPEVGDEVVVGFVQGDLRQPIVLGGLWNGKDRPPPQ